MIVTTNENYLLSPILDHKTKYDLGGIEIHISKDWENNLRLRNCQLGVVEAVPELNPLQLAVGDMVFTHHLVFQSDIAKRRGFNLNPHAEIDGKKIFRVKPELIYLKFVGEDVQQLGTVIIVGPVSQEDESATIKELGNFKDRGRIIYPTEGYEVGDIVMVEKNALYPLEIKGRTIFKIYRKEIVGVLDGEDVIPADGRLLLLDHEHFYESEYLDLTGIAQENTILSEVVKVGNMEKICANNFRPGQKLLRYRNYGIKYKDMYLVGVQNGNIHAIIQ